MVFAMIEEQKMDQFIEYIEAITPEELIGELTQNKPTKSDLDIITGIREQGVTDPVVNIKEPLAMEDLLDNLITSSKY